MYIASAILAYTDAHASKATPCIPPGTFHYLIWRQIGRI